MIRTADRPALRTACGGGCQGGPGNLVKPPGPIKKAARRAGDQDLAQAGVDNAKARAAPISSRSSS